MKFSDLAEGDWFEVHGFEFVKVAPNKYGNAIKRDVGKMAVFNTDVIVKRIPKHFDLELEEGDTFMKNWVEGDTTYTIVRKERNNE